MVNKKAKIVGSIILSAVIAAGVCVGCYIGLTSNEKKNYGANISLEQGASNGIALSTKTYTTSDGDTVQTITATVSPSTAQNAVLDWSVAWGTETGSWGSGSQGTVTDYVTVTPTSDGALTAEVECLQPFGTQAIITASIRNDSAIYATTKVDYVQSLESIASTTFYVVEDGAWDQGYSYWSSNYVSAKALSSGGQIGYIDVYYDQTEGKYKFYSDWIVNVSVTWSDVYTKENDISNATLVENAMAAVVISDSSISGNNYSFYMDVEGIFDPANTTSVIGLGILNLTFTATTSVETIRGTSELTDTYNYVLYTGDGYNATGVTVDVTEINFGG